LKSLAWNGIDVIEHPKLKCHLPYLLRI